VDSIRNLRKDLRKKKEFQVSPLPGVESRAASRQRTASERERLLKTIGLVGGLAGVGILGGRVGYAAGRSGMRRAVREAETRAAAWKSAAESAQKSKSNAWNDFFRQESARARSGDESTWSDFTRQRARASRPGYDEDYMRRSQEARRARQSESNGASRASGSGYGSRPSGASGAAARNPHAGTGKAEAWEKWQSMKRMASESAHEGERAAAAAAAEKWKKRFNLARAMRGLKLFGRADQPRDPTTKRYKDPLWSWATGERLIKIGPDGKQGEWTPESPQLVNSALAHAARARVPLQRGGRLTKDFTDVLQGRERERDASGRIKKREWEKSWFNNILTTAGIGLGTLAGAAAWRHGRMNPQSRWGGFVSNAEQGVRKTREDLNRVAAGVMRGANDMTGRVFAARLRSRLRELDVVAGEAGWDVRDPRGRSARVFAPGSRKRERREKYWHEKKENQQKLWIAGALAAAAAGGLGGAAVYRLAQGKSLLPSFRKAVPEVVARRANGTFSGLPIDPSRAGKRTAHARMAGPQTAEDMERLRKVFREGGGGPQAA
jgi:hypothetical protein